MAAEEQALRDSERMLRLAQKTANAGAYEWDIRKNRVQWSADFARLIGKAEMLSRPSMCGSALFTLITAPMPHRSSVRSRRENGIPYHQYWIIHPDLGLRWLEGTGQLIRDGQEGRFAGRLQHGHHRAQTGGAGPSVIARRGAGRPQGGGTCRPRQVQVPGRSQP